jgi:hypothetical protein
MEQHHNSIPNGCLGAGFRPGQAGAVTELRLTVHATAAKALVAKPSARPGVSAEHAADVLYGVLSPKLYSLIVRDRGCSPGQWEQWTYDTLRSQLCAD